MSTATKELWQGNILASWHGFWGYGLLAAGFAALSGWFGYPALVEQYPGRWALGDDIYASWPLTRSTCFVISAATGIIGAGLFYRGWVLHRRYAKYWKDHQDSLATRWPAMHLVEIFKVNKPIQTLRSDAEKTFKRLQSQVESEIRERLAHTTANPYQKDGLPPKADMKLIDGHFFGSNVPGILQFRWQRHEKEDKWKCIEILVEGFTGNQGIKISVKCSVALHDITDPTRYPKVANPVDVYGTGKKFTSESTSTQSSRTQSAQYTQSTHGTSVTYTDHFVDYTRQPASEDFKFWFEQHTEEFRVYEVARDTVIDTIAFFDRQVEGDPFGGLSDNV